MADPVIVRERGATANHLTLDVGDLQVLVEADEDDDEANYEHLILAHRIRPGEFVAIFPDGLSRFLDLKSSVVIPLALARNAPFPLDERPFRAHGKHSAAQETELRLRAKALASIHDPTVTISAAPSDASWRFSDPAHPRYPDEVPVTILASANRVRVEGSVGLILDDEDPPEWTTIALVGLRDLDKWTAEKLQGRGRDPLRVKTRPTADGTFPLFRHVASEFERNVIPNPNLFGTSPSACLEVVDAIVSSSHEPAGYALELIRNLGVNVRSGLSVEMLVHFHTLFLLAVVDGINLPQTAAGEHLARRLLQQSRAAKRNPRNPDFEGLDMYLNHMSELQTNMKSLKFDKHVAEVQRDRATALKQMRLDREEKELEERRKGAGEGGGRNRRGKKNAPAGAEEV